MLIDLLKEMFNEMVLKKNVSKIPLYYHLDLQVYTNQKKINYREFLQSHQKYYTTELQYEVEYDEDTLFEKDDRVAARMWITITNPGSEPKKLEVMLIAKYKDKKIYRLWELTYPDWSQLETFKE